MVEHAAVNRAVVGSSPTRGARIFQPFTLGFKFLGSSMVEHAAVNRGVVGSSPTGGARTAPPHGGGAVSF